DSPQLRPLSLVTRKVAPDRNPSPPSLELKPSDTEASEYGSISQLNSRHPASAVNLHQKSSNTSPLLQSSLSYTHGFSGSPKHTEPKHHYTSREASLSKDSSFFVPGTWPASSESSAFSQASTRAASPMSDRYSRFMKCEDVRNKIRTATQHNTPLSSMMGNQMFRKTIYPPISSTSSIYPFPSPQLPFPIHPMFQPGQLARALASDYGRIRENFDSASGLRFISTRTPTRDTMKQRGSLLGGHMDSKCVSPDFGGNCPDNRHIQEGLTPQHLKKAKLMFFYTRYPSANMLKAYFSDVKFSRATTSQLIKWFSNFREFYYIQMEKFARQALTEGVTDVGQIVVTRESEIMRVLNLHYNKSNDFRVPDQFIDVTQTSLQEFHQSIKSGKDRDPAWKKVIYKVICKLDHEVPDIFKTPNVLDRLCDAHL
uniref:Prospero domain-containing protein n=1 Tax=Ciona savignyi TaxID=51511 RepID=H2Z5V3_CIOSA